MNLITTFRNKFKLARIVYLDLVYFAGVKNLSTQFRDDMVKAFQAGVITDPSDQEEEVFHNWFKENYL